MNKNLENKDLKEILDNLVLKYQTPAFIPDDPIKFPHMFDNQQDQEVSGLIASSLAYGKREKIIESIEKIHKIMNFKPYEFATNFDFAKESKYFEDFIYRYTSGYDVALMISSIGKALQDYKTLEDAFLEGFSVEDNNIKQALTGFVNILRSYSTKTTLSIDTNLQSIDNGVCCRGEAPTQQLFPLLGEGVRGRGKNNLKGLYFLLPSPEKGSACKRLNMFLRWMVRSGPVDLGIWKNIPASKLLIPLDTHVAKVSRQLGLTSRKVDDWKTAEEITDRLREFDPQDPAKYDFAIFGMGIFK